MIDFVFTMLRETALIPAAVSLVVAAVVHWLCPGRLPGAVAVGCGFFAGWASQDWGRLLPRRYLDWSPWVAVVLAITGCLMLLTDRRWIRLLLLLVACTAGAWLLVPDFPRLVPKRPVAVPLVAGLGLITTSGLLLVDRRVADRVFRIGFVMIGSTCALILAQSFGLKFSQMAGMLTAAVGGPLVFASPPGRGASGVVFLPLLAAIMFMGYANSSSDVPVFCYFLPLLACLPLLIQAQRSPASTASGDDLQPAGPTPARTLDSQGAERSGGMARPTTNAQVVSWGLVILLLIVAAVPAILAHPPWEEDLG